MELTAIEVKAVSCRDLTLPLALFGKPPVYAVVSLGNGTGRAGRRQTQSTPFDRAGGRNPEWDQELRFDLAGERSYLSLFLEFEFVARRGVGGVLGDPVVGEAQVCLRDLAEEYAAATAGGGLRSVGYQVRSREGKCAGVVTFFYKITFTSPVQVMESPVQVPASPTTKLSPFQFYPPPPPSAAVSASAVQQPAGAMYIYCCPIPPSPPPSDVSGRPIAGYDFSGRGYVESWAAPSLRFPAGEPYDFPRKGAELGGGTPGDAWKAEYGAHCAPTYPPPPPLGRFAS